MNPKLKLGLYAVLLILAAWFAWGFYSNYNAVAAQSAQAAINETASVSTNEPVTTTNSPAGTNATAVSNAVAQTNPAPSAPATNSATTPTPSVKRGFSGSAIGYLAALVGAIIGLGLLIAYDATQMMGNAAVDFLFDDRAAGERAPEYEKAEQVWADGKHLDAIQMLRDFLKTNPRAQYAALRIAEIYEKDLRNYVAAAMEYEDILKQKLPAERWGWAAIHLCNLYSKLNQQDKAMALLQRIADDFPKTGAAKKARARLGIPEPEPEPLEEPHTQPAGEPEADVSMEAEADAGPEPTLPEPEPPKPNLPPGFRPKK